MSRDIEREGERAREKEQRWWKYAGKEDGNNDDGEIAMIRNGKMAMTMKGGIPTTTNGGMATATNGCQKILWTKALIAVLQSDIGLLQNSLTD